MPSGEWVRFEPASESHSELPELFVRRGAIIPMGPAMQYVGERPLDPLTLAVFPDDRGAASGSLMDDDGERSPPERKVAERFTCNRIDGRLVITQKPLHSNRSTSGAFEPGCSLEVLVMDGSTVRRGLGPWGSEIVIG